MILNKIYYKSKTFLFIELTKICMTKYTSQVSTFAALLLWGAFCLQSCGSDAQEGAAQEESAAVTQNVSLTDTKQTYVEIEDAQNIDPKWSKDNVVVFHFIGEPDDLHPTNGNAASRTFIFEYTQGRLIGTDFANLDARAELVKSMPEVSENQLEFTYELRDEPTFDDGQQLSVEDVIFTLKAAKCPLVDNPHAKPYLENLKDIVVDPQNPRRFTLVMKKPYIQNIFFLASNPIIQRSYFDPQNVLSAFTIPQFDDPNFNPDSYKDLNDWASEFNSSKYGRTPEFLVGLGPYQVSAWDPGQSITITRKANHWVDKIKQEPFDVAYPEKIVFKINKDKNSQMLEFKSQVMDASTYLSTTALSELQADAEFNNNYHSRFTDTYNYWYAGMNTKPDGIEFQKYFTDKRVRRAIALLTPVDDMNAVINEGRNTRMIGPVSPLKKSYNSNLQPLPYDPEEAKRLLDEAGWTDTDGDNIRDKVIDGKKVKFSFTLNYMTTQDTWKQAALMMKESFYKAGLEAKLNALDFAIHYDNAKNHRFDMMLAAWAGSSVPSDFTQIWHTKSWVSKGSNFTGFGTAESDALIDSIKVTLDDAKRIPMVKKLQEIIYEEQPYVFMFASTRRNVIHKRFGNADMYFERPGVILNNLRLLSGAGGAIREEAAN